jgi:hypothetical protein
MVNQFCNFVFMKFNIEKQHSSSTKPITCTIASSANLIYFRIFFENLKANKGSPQLNDYVDMKWFLHCQLSIVYHAKHKQRSLKVKSNR